MEQLFLRFAGGKEILDLDDITALCEQIGIDAANDIRSMVLMWKLGAKSLPGAIKKEEFLAGLKALQVDSLEGLKALVPSFDPGFLIQNEFRDFFKFVFNFSREGTNKTIEKDLIILLLGMVLSRDRLSHLDSLLEYLNSSDSVNYSRINLDQWSSFLRFQTVLPDLSNFDEDGAWPILIDDYVKWKRAKSV